MSVVKDALSPLAPPPPTATPVVDATIVPEEHPLRLRFDAIKQMPDSDPQKYVLLMALIQEFVDAGHNPRAAEDVMFSILGISPETLEGLVFFLEAESKKAGPAPVALQPAANDPAPAVAPAADAAPAPLPETAAG